MRILFAGSPSVAAASLRRIAAHPLTSVVGVVTQPPRRAGRKRAMTRSPVHEEADALGLTVLTPERAHDVAFLDTLRSDAPPDLCVTVAFGQILPRAFLEIPRIGTVNIHPSLLPDLRGAAPVQRALERGDERVGVSVLTTVRELDAGPILAQRAVAVEAEEQAPALLSRLMDAGTSLLLDELVPSLLAGGADGAAALAALGTPQDAPRATHAALIEKREGALDPRVMDADRIHRMVRAFAEWPRCSLEAAVLPPLGDVSMKILKSRLVPPGSGVAEGRGGEEAGGAAVWEHGGRVFLRCAGGSALELLEVQPATKRAMDARSWWNGAQRLE